MKLKKRFSLSLKNNLRFLPDRAYINLYYHLKFGFLPNVDEPLTFNEKLQWMKLYYRDLRLPKFVDKYEARSFVAERVGEDYLVPLIGVYETIEEFLAANLPEQFVVKCTHDSQSVHLCVDKSSFDFETAAKELQVALRRNWYWQGREWAYKGVRPRIIVEKLLQDQACETPNDYKFYCFDGVVKMVQCDFDRFGTNHTQQFFSPTWESYGDKDYYDIPEKKLHKKPATYDEMLVLSEKLSADFPHVRVDWYCIDGKPLFGELTFYTGGGFDPFHEKEDKISDRIDRYLGDCFTLPAKLSL